MSPPHVALVCSGPPQKRGHLWLNKVASVLRPLDARVKLHESGSLKRQLRRAQLALTTRQVWLADRGVRLVRLIGP